MSINLISALLTAQSQFPAIPKDKENPHFKARYSSLDAIQSACWPVLHKNNILPQFKTETVDGKLTVTFMLTHTESGESVANALTVEAGPTVQAIGSQITYLRRYTAAPALGICSDEDDDGNLAAATPKRTQRPTKPAEPRSQLPAPPRLTDDTDLAAWERHDAAAYIAHCKTSQQLLELLNRLAATPEWAGNGDWPWACKLITEAYRLIVGSNPKQKNDEFVFQMKRHAEAIQAEQNDPFQHPKEEIQYEPIPEGVESADV